jgi:peptidyl-prolyl cis-trans isomerase C
MDNILETPFMTSLKKSLFSLLVLPFSLFLSGSVLAEEAQQLQPVAAPPQFTVPDPVAVVNGTPIPKATFDLYAQQLSGQAPVDSPEASQALIDQLILEELLVQEAHQQNLTEDPEIQQQLTMIQRSLLASTVMRRMLNADAPSADAIQKEYETAVAAMRDKEYKASHILVDSEDKAKEIIAELQKGGQFAELAKTHSSDGSAANGGELGWFTPNMMVPPFAQAVTQMEKGKYSEQPVQTPFGWHVILLEDTRDTTPPALEELKPQITQMLQSRKVNDYLEQLRSGAEVEVMEIQVSEAEPVPATESGAAE